MAIIGGSGFIGTKLAVRLLDAGHSIRIIDKAESRVYPELWIKGDVRDSDALRVAMEGCQVVYNLAAEHRDDVRPRSLYSDVNVRGAENVCQAARELGLKKIIFTSSVAVYGFTEKETDESGEPRPFNDYGRTKLEAEKAYRGWQEKSGDSSLTIIRPTVVFGEGNRGNVYNLLNQIASGKFLMVGNGRNHKSMAYVENVVSFLEFALRFGPGCHLFNYIDKPDLDMNSLISLVSDKIGNGRKKLFRLPYRVGYAGGLVFDAVSRLTGKKFPISSIRIKKFCSDTLFSSSGISETGFTPPYSLEEGLLRTIQYEFLQPRTDSDILFHTE
ncbi:MAG TPA: NAD(P)-dependent oxidoreductase [Nitrospirae bacterium]|nr:NAD(P)-dependent oxidoreductase [Nitrospirota bacterium]